MSAYTVQSFSSDRGEIAAAKVIAPQTAGMRIVPVSGAEVTLTPEPGTRYQCGELTALTVSDPPAVGAWELVFASGAVPTVTTIPQTVLGLDEFAAGANTVCEINVLDGRALTASWETAQTP